MNREEGWERQTTIHQMSFSCSGISAYYYMHGVARTLAVSGYGLIQVVYKHLWHPSNWTSPYPMNNLVKQIKLSARKKTYKKRSHWLQFSLINESYVTLNMEQVMTPVIEAVCLAVMPTYDITLCPYHCEDLASHRCWKAIVKGVACHINPLRYGNQPAVNREYELNLAILSFDM